MEKTKEWNFTFKMPNWLRSAFAFFIMVLTIINAVRFAIYAVLSIMHPKDLNLEVASLSALVYVLVISQFVGLSSKHRKTNEEKEDE